MKKVIFTLILALAASVIYAQSREIYTNPDFVNIAGNHKEIAILPFHVTMDLRPKQRQSMTDEQYQQMIDTEGLAVQSALESFFLKRKDQHEFSVNFQSTSKTNALLKKNRINNDNISSFTPEELAKILEVDAVITGIFKTSKPMSEGAAIALGLFVGIYGPTNSGNIAININNGSGGELLWKYEKQLSRSLGSDTGTIINTMMRKASKKFPYNKV